MIDDDVILKWVFFKTRFKKFIQKQKLEVLMI
jgi:hypothetical protein